MIPQWFRDEILSLVNFLTDSGLRYAPRNPARTAEIWTDVLWHSRNGQWRQKDIPVLRGASGELVATTDDFPTPKSVLAKFRESQAMLRQLDVERSRRPELPAYTEKFTPAEAADVVKKKNEELLAMFKKETK